MDFITIGLFITSEILPYIKNYIGTLKAGDVNSIAQLLYYSGWSVATCLYYVCSGTWSKEQKKKKLLKKAKEIEEILSDEIRAELRRRIEEEEKSIDLENQEEEEKNEIQPQHLDEIKDNVSKEMKKLKWGRKANKV